VSEYYKSDEDYFRARSRLGKEYKAITDSGILVQVDDPFQCDNFVDPALDEAGKKRRAEIYVEATNAALAGIPAERVRFHTCYGINEGPRSTSRHLPSVCFSIMRAPTFEAAIRATSTNITCSKA
jgi:5-methyltetrahydropteroyltriglutamate--homocysteine methyltransferase